MSNGKLRTGDPKGQEAAITGMSDTVRLHCCRASIASCCSYDQGHDNALSVVCDRMYGAGSMDTPLMCCVPSVQSLCPASRALTPLLLFSQSLSKPAFSTCRSVEALLSPRAWLGIFDARPWLLTHSHMYASRSTAATRKGLPSLLKALPPG